MRRVWHLTSAVAFGIVALAACSAHAVNDPTPPVAAQSIEKTSATTQTTSSVTVSGPVTAIISSTEFSVQSTHCGSIHIFTNSSTTFSPSGAKPAVGENTTDSGTGSCATYVDASSVTITSTPAPTPSASPSPLPKTYTVGSGAVFGLDNYFNPNDGNTASGGQGQTVDSTMPCVGTMPNTYHAHAFLGIIVNGRQYAVPDGIGMYKPGGDITYAGFNNWTEYASCYYYMHTHDASGVMHIESTQSVPVSTSIFTLKNFFDVWGMPLSSTQIGPFTGTVTAYVAQVAVKTDPVPSSDYVQYTGDPATIPLKSHTVVWLQIGPKIYTPSQLPSIMFYEEY